MISILVATVVFRANAFAFIEARGGIFLTDGRSRIPLSSSEHLSSRDGVKQIWERPGGQLMVGDSNHSRKVSMIGLKKVLLNYELAAHSDFRKWLKNVRHSAETVSLKLNCPTSVPGGWALLATWYPTATSAGCSYRQDILFVPTSVTGSTHVLRSLGSSSNNDPNFQHLRGRHFVLSHSTRGRSVYATYFLEESTSTGRSLTRLLNLGPSDESSSILDSFENRWLLIKRVTPNYGDNLYTFDCMANSAWRVPIAPQPRDYSCWLSVISKSVDAPFIAVQDQAASWKPIWVVNVKSHQVTRLKIPKYEVRTTLMIWKGKAFTYPEPTWNGAKIGRSYDLKSGNELDRIPILQE